MFYAHLSFFQYLLITLLLTHISIESVTIFLHRYQAHRALEMHPVLSHLFRFWLWLSTGMLTKEWVSVHRKHHATVETKNDPHSPIFYGIWRVIFEGVILYRREAKKADTLEKFGKDTPNDWLEKNLYSHGLLGPLIMLAFMVLLFGKPGFYMWLVLMIWIPFFGAGVINGIGHFWRYRNHKTTDNSKNIVPWGILVGGEELHNNHHKFPWSARFSHYFWEVDLSWLYLKVLEKAGLIKNLKEPNLQNKSVPS